jgi:hypothetical protein
MPQYTDPDRTYTMTYPDGWLPLTHEGSAHISLASLATGGYLKIEAYQCPDPSSAPLPPARILQALIECERRKWPRIGSPAIQTRTHRSVAVAQTAYTRVEGDCGDEPAGFGHTRAWVFSHGNVQVRCLYRCRSGDAGLDDDDLEAMLGTLVIHPVAHLDAPSFARYYFSLLKRRRPQLLGRAPETLALTMADGQTILLDQLYNQYCLEPERMDELIDRHMGRLDYCGDDVPDLKSYRAIKKLLFPKVVRADTRNLPPHRLRFWPGLAIGAVVRGAVFTYGVNTERLRGWGFGSLDDILDQLLDNLYNIPPVRPRGLRDDKGCTRAISYVDHPFSASFILFEDFFQTTAHNLGVSEFLVGLPDPGCVSCYRDDDPRFVVEHTALLRRDYHRSAERLTDAIYLVTGPDRHDVQPYDILHCCPKQT